MRSVRIAALLAIAAPVFAQSTGEIRGIAWTAEGKPLAGVQVVVHNATENSHLTVVSAADGTFAVPNLPPGRYWIAGYSEPAQLITESSVKVDLTAGEKLHADVTLGKNVTPRGKIQRLLRRLDGLH